MKRTTAPALATLLALLASTAALVLPASPEARADEPAAGKSEDASQRFKSGVAFYKDRDFTAALVEFKRAYELSPNYNVLYNLGQTARELKDHAAALTAFERYLREGGAKITAARRKEVSAAIDELRRKVGTLAIVTSVPAEITVDDVVVGTSPLPGPVVINAGRRKVSAQASGHTPAQRIVDVAATEQTALSLDLPAIGAGRIEPPPPPPKRAPSRVAWVLLSATGASALAASVTGVLAVSAHGSLEHALATFPGNPQTISSAQSRTRTFAVTTDVLLGVTAAAALTTAAFFFVVPRFQDKATVGLSPTGVLVRGAF